MSGGSTPWMTMGVTVVGRMDRIARKALVPERSESACVPRTDAVSLRASIRRIERSGQGDPSESFDTRLRASSIEPRRRGTTGTAP